MAFVPECLGLCQSHCPSVWKRILRNEEEILGQDVCRYSTGVPLERFVNPFRAQVITNYFKIGLGGNCVWNEDKIYTSRNACVFLLPVEVKMANLCKVCDPKISFILLWASILTGPSDKPCNLCLTQFYLSSLFFSLLSFPTISATVSLSSLSLISLFVYVASTSLGHHKEEIGG